MKVVRKKISDLVKKKFFENSQKKRNKSNIPLFWTLNQKKKKKNRNFFKLYFSKVEGLLKIPGSGDV